MEPGAKKRLAGVEYWFDDKPARKFVNLCRQHLRHLKGPAGGEPVIMENWQMEWIIKPLLGWRRPDGTRQYRETSIWIPRKNGKSFLIGSLMLFLLIADDEPGAEIYLTASAREQAAELYDVLRAQVEGSPQLQTFLEARSKRILFPQRQSYLAVLASEAGPIHGRNPHAVAIDELHVHKNRDLYDALTSGRGVRRQPLIITISTAGQYDETHIAWNQYQRARHVAHHPEAEPALLPVIYEAPKEARFDDPAVWRICNPGLDGAKMVTEEFLREEAHKARTDPAAENRFRQLHLNQWVAQVTRWIPLDQWLEGTAADEPAAGAEAILGLDFSYSSDLSAAALLFPRKIAEKEFPQDAPGTGSTAEKQEAYRHLLEQRAAAVATSYEVLLRIHFWKPAEGIAEAARADHADYPLWAQQGAITLCPGSTIDQEQILAWIEAQRQRYTVRRVAFDPAYAAGVVSALEASGCDIVAIRQGPLTLGGAARLFEGLIKSRRIKHDANPVMSYCVNNLAVKTDQRGNIYPAKSRSRGRIDGVSATLTALAELMRQPFEFKKTSVYETRGIELL